MVVDNKNDKMSNGQTDIKLLSWYKFIVGLLFSGLVVYKLAVSNFTFDFSKFDFNALLALLLSLFAIALSVAFYFKATDTSNLFYDNTYKFTKEISEILGRIEAGFGERLRHLDEGYTGLVSKFDNGFNEVNINETKEEIEKEKQKLKQEMGERNKIINSLIGKANLEKGEKEIILKQLKEREIEISKQKRELNFLRNRLKIEKDNEEGVEDVISVEAYRFLRDYLRHNKIDPEMLLKYPTSIINRKFRIELETLSKNVLIMLLNSRIINEDGSFTIHGIRTLRHIAKELTK
ncbi:MAG: hypothetical protein WAZ36_04225 [Sediminibacterium sp.]